MGDAKTIVGRGLRGRPFEIDGWASRLCLGSRRVAPLSQTWCCDWFTAYFLLRGRLRSSRRSIGRNRDARTRLPSWVRAIHLDEGGGSYFNSNSHRQDGFNRGRFRCNRSSSIGRNQAQTSNCRSKQGPSPRRAFTPARPRTAKWEHETFRRNVMERRRDGQPISTTIVPPVEQRRYICGAGLGPMAYESDWIHECGWSRSIATPDHRIALVHHVKSNIFFP
jgi:hypothetical protein